jgi:hypothetical protein
MESFSRLESDVAKQWDVPSISLPCGLNTFVFCVGVTLKTAAVCSSASEMDQYRLIVSIALPIAPALGFNTSTRDVKRLAAMR